MAHLTETAAAHAGHDHGVFGEFIEGLISNIPISEQWRDFISHFLIDCINILFILAIVMTAVYFLNSYINTQKLHDKLTHLRSIWGFFLATFLGVLSPFCSCSIVPLLIGFISVGVPVSVCLCFLTASSLINFTAIISVFAVMGPEFGLVYLICSVIIIIISSVAFSILKLDSCVRDFHSGHDEHHHHNEPFDKNEKVTSRIKSSLLSMLCVMKKCLPFIVIGVALSSALMAFVSVDILEGIVSENSFVSALIVGVIGLPIHSDIFSISPVLLLLNKLSPGVALTLILSTMAVSIPSMVILSRTLKGKAVALYSAVISVCAIAIGCISLLIF